jgi:pSer/pThr/pTyr-binding forkhead associated (FHA) protein
MTLALRLRTKESACSPARLEVPVAADGLLLGRSRDADFQVASGTVARHHAKVLPIEGDDDAVVALCLESTNGTQIRRSNGALVEIPRGGQLRLEVGESLVLASEFELELVKR